jgi:hypothetical protein
MPGLEKSTQGLVNGLFSEESSVRLASVRKIKNAIIGNKMKKSSFVLLGVIPRLVSLLSQDVCEDELVREAIITLGSFAHGTSQNVQAVLNSKALPLLVKALSHTDSAVVSSSVRTLRIIYESDLAPSGPIFSDRSTVRLLVHMVSGTPLLAQSATTVLTKACQCSDHQNQLCALGIMEPLAFCLQSSVTKLVHASLICLAALTLDNTVCASIIMTASCGDSTLLSTISKAMSGSHTSDIKLAAALCVSRLCQCGVLSHSNSIVTLRALPTLVRLCKAHGDVPVNTQAAHTLAILTSDSVDLQELAASSDHLITTLVGYLGNRPDENDELMEERHQSAFDRLREACLLALASISSSREEIRLKIVSERHLMKHVGECLSGENVEVKIAACKCLHSLSRSTKLLRTTIIDTEAWRPILEMLSLRDEECLNVATGVSANLLLAFSPSRKKMVAGGCLQTLCQLVSHDNPGIKLNAIWALMSCAYDSTDDIRAQIKEHLTIHKMFELLSPSCSERQLLKSLGLVVNLLSEPEEVEWLLQEHGSEVWSSLLALLSCHSNNSITEQVMCVLMNVASATERTKDNMVEHDEILSGIAAVLRDSERIEVLTATCTVVKHLVDSSISGVCLWVYVV